MFSSEKTAFENFVGGNVSIVKGTSEDTRSVFLRVLKWAVKLKGIHLAICKPRMENFDEEYLSIIMSSCSRTVLYREQKIDFPCIGPYDIVLIDECNVFSSEILTDLFDGYIDKAKIMCFSSTGDLSAVSTYFKNQNFVVNTYDISAAIDS